MNFCNARAAQKCAATFMNPRELGGSVRPMAMLLRRLLLLNFVCTSTSKVSLEWYGAAW